MFAAGIGIAIEHRAEGSIPIPIAMAILTTWVRASEGVQRLTALQGGALGARASCPPKRQDKTEVTWIWGFGTRDARAPRNCKPRGISTKVIRALTAAVLRIAPGRAQSQIIQSDPVGRGACPGSPLDAAPRRESGLIHSFRTPKQPEGYRSRVASRLI